MSAAGLARYGFRFDQAEAVPIHRLRAADGPPCAAGEHPLDDRRARDSRDLDNMRARTFEDRAALVLDRFNVVSDAYRRTIEYYGRRNGIAHGTNPATRIEVPAVIGDRYRIAGELAS